MKESDIKFQPLADIDIDRYKAIVGKYVPYSDHNYTSLFCWDTENQCEVSELSNNGILIRMDNYLDDPESKFLLTFAGQTKADDIQNIIEKIDHSINLDLLPPYIINRLKRAGLNGFVFEEDRDNFDYIIATKNYGALKGGGYSNKRKKINNFTNTFGDRLKIEEVSLGRLDRPALLKLYANWMGYNTDGSQQAEGEILALKKLLNNAWLSKHFQFINLEYRIDGELSGFSISESTGKNYAVGHFMKANLEIRYLYDYIAYHTSKYLGEKYSIDYFNIEQDLGIVGLRTYKERHNPHKFLKKYHLKRIV